MFHVKPDRVLLDTEIQRHDSRRIFTCSAVDYDSMCILFCPYLCTMLLMLWMFALHVFNSSNLSDVTCET